MRWSQRSVSLRGTLVALILAVPVVAGTAAVASRAARRRAWRAPRPRASPATHGGGPPAEGGRDRPRAEGGRRRAALAPRAGGPLRAARPAIWLCWSMGVAL